MKVIFASHNPGKIKEMNAILADLGIEAIGAEAAGISLEPEENGKTFAENALLKARFVLEKIKEKTWVIADDSGLCIHALNGAPGVFSARWAGEGVSSKEMVSHTLEELKDVPEPMRTAWMESAVVLISPDGQEWTFDGRVYGLISFVPKGAPRSKMPYDAIFIPRNFTKTFAEMTDEEKNSLSHRGEAFRKMKYFIKKNLDLFSK
ncbi:MAG: RdgB/HAM1 family non-canonical purine NTP pyrophosphatase [Patescibacteria group bacterium]|jgi:XTP/dITP diphosphohydrolase